jgi:hypothetical protein
MGAVFLGGVLQRPFTGLVPSILVIALTSAVGAAVAVSVDRLFPGIGGFIAAGCLAATVTAALLWSLDRRLDLGLTASLMQAYPRIANIFSFLPVRT